MMRPDSDPAQCLARTKNPDPAQFLTPEEADMVTYFRNCGPLHKEALSQLALTWCSREIAKTESSVLGIFPGYIQRGPA